MHWSLYMKNNISTVVVNHDCAGCGVCAAICAADAITLQENTAGFYEASITESSCLDCGLCRKICPRLHNQLSKPLYEGTLYALQSTSSVAVQGCSSGGVAHELSEAFLQTGGKVAGAIYDLDTHRVRHELISDVCAIMRLDGSKYLQSDTTEAFSKAIQTAEEDHNARFLLFGTPCQIAGLAAAAEHKGIRDQFLLAEVFCHGVPSYRIWDETVGKISKRLGTDRWDAVKFRYKKDDWHSYCLRVDSGEKHYYGKRETELFWQVFFENILLNDACWNCQSRKAHSCADLRLGDYWGARFMERSDGVSAVFAVTQRGNSAVQQLISAGRLHAFNAGTADEMLSCQNMEGYKQASLHRQAMELLRRGVAVQSVVRQYRSGLSAKQKVKAVLLRISAALPDSLRAKARKQLHKVRKS